MILGFHWKYYNVNLFYTSTSVIGNASNMCGDVTNGAHVARYWLPPMGPTRSCPLPNLLNICFLEIYRAFICENEMGTGCNR